MAGWKQFRETLSACAHPLLLLLLILSMAGVGCASTKQHAAQEKPVVCEEPLPDFLHSQFSERRAKLTNVVVLTPRTDIFRLTYGGRTTLLSNETAAVSQRLPGIVVARLQKLGFSIRPAQTDTNEPAVDSAGQFLEARARIKEWMTEEPLRPYEFLMTTNGRLGLATAAKVLASHAQADALVFAELWGKKNSLGRTLREGHAAVVGAVGLAGICTALFFAGSGGGGADLSPAYYSFRELGWAATGGSDDYEHDFGGVYLQVVIVDGATGEVLWAKTQKGHYEGKKLEKLVGNVFQEFQRGERRDGVSKGSVEEDGSVGTF